MATTETALDRGHRETLCEPITSGLDWGRHRFDCGYTPQSSRPFASPAALIQRSGVFISAKDYNGFMCQSTFLAHRTPLWHDENVPLKYPYGDLNPGYWNENPAS